MFFKVFFQKKTLQQLLTCLNSKFCHCGLHQSFHLHIRQGVQSVHVHAMSCHDAMPFCYVFAPNQPKHPEVLLRKENFLLSFVAICTHLLPQCNQVVFVNQPGRNHEMYFLFCWQQIDSFLRKLSWSRRRSLTTSPALYCPLSVCNQYISIARIMNCLSFTWIAERIFVGFSNRLTLS